MSVDNNKNLGFTLQRSIGRRFSARKVTDADYADDLALLSDDQESGERPLHVLEHYAASIGLFVNAKKTEVMDFNQPNEIQITATNGNSLKIVDSFVYLGSEISSTDKDITIRNAKA